MRAALTAVVAKGEDGPAVDGPVAIFDIDEQGLRLTRAELFESFDIDWTDEVDADPWTKTTTEGLASLLPGETYEVGMGAHGVFAVRRVS